MSVTCACLRAVCLAHPIVPASTNTPPRGATFFLNHYSFLPFCKLDFQLGFARTVMIGDEICAGVRGNQWEMFHSVENRG